MPGIYSVTVTDRTACFSVCSEEVILNRCRNAPSPATSLCEGESSELCTPLVAGNTYEWSTARRPTALQWTCRAFIPVTVTDPNGCFSVCSEEVASTRCRFAPSLAISPSAKASPASFARPVVIGNTYEWSTGDVQLHYSGHAGHLFGHRY